MNQGTALLTGEELEGVPQKSIPVLQIKWLFFKFNFECTSFVQQTKLFSVSSYLKPFKFKYCSILKLQY